VREIFELESILPSRRRHKHPPLNTSQQHPLTSSPKEVLDKGETVGAYVRSSKYGTNGVKGWLWWS